MRKLLGLIVVVALLLSAVTVPAAAVPVTDLTALARYFPVSAPLYVGVRTDDAFFNEDLQGVLDLVAGALPAEFAGEIPSVGALLDEISADAPMGNNFEDVFRPWLGDTLAIGALSAENINDDGEFMVVAASTSLDEADKFWSEVIDSAYTRTASGDVITFTPENTAFNPYVYLDNEVVIVSSQPINPLTREARLDSVEAFNEAFARLPEDSYNIAMYIDLPTLARASAEESGMGAEVDAASAVLDDLGAAAVGFTIVDGRSLTIDITTGAPAGTYAAVDPQFADHVPANTPLIIHGTNLAATYRSAIDAAREAAIASGTPEAEIEEGLAELAFTVRGLTGLELETEILAWMTGDYILALGLSPMAQDASSIFGLMAGFPADFAIVIDASADPSAAQAFAAGLSGTLAQFADGENLIATTDTIDGVDVTVLTIIAPDLPFPVEIIMGASDEVFYLGTRGYATTAFTLENGLIADPDFVEGWGYALQDANYFLYASGVPLAPLGTLLAGMNGSSSEGPNEGDALRGLLNLLTSSSISTTISDDVVLSRLVLTLGE